MTSPATDTAVELMLAAISAHPNAVDTSDELTALSLVACGFLEPVQGKRWHFKTGKELRERIKVAVKNELIDMAEERSA